MKEVVFLGASLEDLRSFPKNAKSEMGYQLDRIQQGLDPTDWKPMPSIGKGVKEIRIHVEGEYRVFYLTKIEDNVYVLHSFNKKTRKTSKKDIDLAKIRLSKIRRI